jgi:heparosan-N-sulfate-glucuronate 5-epimerase
MEKVRMPKAHFFDLRTPKKTIDQILRYARIISGRSYFHQSLILGSKFEPGHLAGYFIDLRGKTNWTGEVDEDGIPLLKLMDGRRLHFATTIVQKALGHWDLWLVSQKDVDRDKFLHLCLWLVLHQDSRGGWDVITQEDSSLLSRYSAMTQGQCISAFVRACTVSNDERFVRGARSALQLLRTPVEQGGPVLLDCSSVFLEEFATSPRCSILNGWIFALFGLYDFCLAVEDLETQQLFRKSLDTLETNLAKYDAGYWSYYDQCGHISSSFYHELHIHQLTALAMIENNPIIVSIRDRWIGYSQRPVNRMRAFFVKAAQKLHEPAVH